MQRIINDPNLVVEDMLKGFAKCYQNLVVPIEENPRVLKYIKAPIQGKVGVVTGGGSGHKPAFVGYVGKNMWTRWRSGKCFPRRPLRFFMTRSRSPTGARVVCLYGNYAGDNMNVKMAKQLAAMDGIEVKTVVANDDVALRRSQSAEATRRRGRGPDVESRRGQSGTGRFS